jgi:Hemerythrin HHE cation binding domain
MRGMSASVILASLFLVLTESSGTSGQEQPAKSRVAMLEAPHALRMEHKYLREDLARALAESGGVGNAARDIERALLPHLEREEKLPFRPLGLLRGIARDATSAELTQAVSMAVQIERELPTLLEEHRVIGEAAKRLVDVARRERKPESQALADRL